MPKVVNIIQQDNSFYGVASSSSASQGYDLHKNKQPLVKWLEDNGGAEEVFDSMFARKVQQQSQETKEYNPEGLQYFIKAKNGDDVKLSLAAIESIKKGELDSLIYRERLYNGAYYPEIVAEKEKLAVSTELKDALKAVFKKENN